MERPIIRELAARERELNIAVLQTTGSDVAVPDVGTAVRELLDGGMGSLSSMRRT